MAIAIVEELWTRIRAAIDDKITAATDARDQAVTAKNGAVTAQTAAETAAANAATVAEAKAIAEVDKLKAGAPAAFDTLLEIANELGENETERAALANSIAAKADKAYVDSETVRVEQATFSRGQQSVINGNGQLGGEYWSDFLTFVPTDAPTGTFGSWENPEKQSVAWNSREIVIDPTLPTYMSAYARQAKAGGSGSMYLALAAVDQDGEAISAVNIMFREGSATTLAQDLKPGDTTVHLTDASNWYNGSNSTPRRMIFWNYVSASGKVWGPETYSRNVTGDSTWLEGGVDYNSNTITLRVPWSGNPVPAGTYLSNGNNGSNYMYARQSNVNHESWEKLEGTVAGKQDLTGLGFATHRGWPPGVAAVRPGILINYSGTPSVSNMRFANVYVSQLAPLGHTHSQSEVTGLEDALANKAGTGHTHTSANISDATTVGQSLMTAADAAAARTAIGAGTSSLALGTTSSTAAAGNHTHSQYATTTTVSARPALFSGSGTPPASIPGSVVGDWWLDTVTMDLYKITGV